MFALDPLLTDLTAGDIAIVLLKVVVIFVLGLVATMLMVWFERKAIAGMQNRIGPNKAGPFGILQTLADGIKLFFKEDLIPDKSDRFVFKLAPYLAFVPAFLVWSVIPLGGDFSGGKDGTVVLFGHATKLQLADPAIGVLLLLALSSISVYGIMLAGWSSGSKYPLLGSVRASAQMVSYEAALGLSLAAVILVTQTLSTNEIVTYQSSLSKMAGRSPPHSSRSSSSSLPPRPSSTVHRSTSSRQSRSWSAGSTPSTPASASPCSSSPSS
jgi:NADH-quinone oxidoreductase subunit H